MYLRTQRKLVSCARQDIPKVSKINEHWAINFVSDALYDSRRIRALTIIDAFSRESLGILVNKFVTIHSSNKNITIQILLLYNNLELITLPKQNKIQEN